MSNLVPWYEPQNLDQALEMADILVRSKLVPTTCTKEQALVILIAGKEAGLGPMQSFQNINVVQGKVCYTSAFISAKAASCPACEYFTMIESTPTQATFETKRRGAPEPVRLTYTLEQAKTQGLATKENWRKMPADMLRARCSSALARAVYPDAVGGLYDGNEFPDPVVPQASTRVATRVVAALAEKPSRRDTIPDQATPPTEAPRDQAPASRDQAPASIDAVLVDDMTGDLFTQKPTADLLKKKIDGAHDLMALKSMVGEIRESNLTEPEKDELRDLYRDKKAKLGGVDARTAKHRVVNDAPPYDPTAGMDTEDPAQFGL